MQPTEKALLTSWYSHKAKGKAEKAKWQAFANNTYWHVLMKFKWKKVRVKFDRESGLTETMMGGN